MKKDAKRLIKLAESHGYAYADSNAKGVLRYTHSARPDLLIAPWLGEHAARALTRDVLAAVGEPAAAAKRNPAAVRERQARQREQLRRERDSHQSLLDSLTAERDRMLCGHGANLTSREIAAIEGQIERAQCDLARTQRLMTEIPASREHSGTGRPARHTAGAR